MHCVYHSQERYRSRHNETGFGSVNSMRKHRGNDHSTIINQVRRRNSRSRPCTGSNGQKVIDFCLQWTKIRTEASDWRTLLAGLRDWKLVLMLPLLSAKNNHFLD